MSDIAENTGSELPTESTVTDSASADQVDTTSTETADDDLVVDELSLLKQRAKLLGIVYSNNIGIEKLKEKIKEKLASDEATASANTDPEPQPEQTIDELEATAPVVKPKSLRQQIRDENLRLIRVRYTNMDPKKKDLPGEVLTVANELLGTVKRFVPFGEAAENGWHVEQCILKMMQAKKFLSIRITKGDKGREVVRREMVREYAIELLPPLTTAELKALATQQAAAQGT